MTDAHCHICRGAARHFICDPTTETALSPSDIRFVGVHPWQAESYNVEVLREKLAANAALGVGEIGLDRLRNKTISSAQQSALASQLNLASELRRPVVLHGAKCWGEVVKACQLYGREVPAYLFHGFSRSEGLLKDIFNLNGFVSIGPALLNDHAVNYRQMAIRLPQDRLLVESDATAETAVTAPRVEEIAAKLAELRSEDPAALNAALEANATRFVESLL